MTHEHKFTAVYTTTYRDEYRNRYALLIFGCDCGAGKRELIPETLNPFSNEVVIDEL